MLRACKDGDLETVKNLAHHVDTQHVKDYEWPYDRPLHKAARNGHLDIVTYLVNIIHCSADVNNNIGETPLHLACQNGHMKIAAYLVTEACCDVNVKSSKGETPLHMAWLNDDLTIFEYLITEAHCDANVINNNGDTPLHFACQTGHLKTVKCLLTKARCDVNVNNFHEDTPLHIASRYCQLDIVTYLATETHCDVNAKNENGETPLHLACMEGHLIIITYLVAEVHCNVNLKNIEGESPLHLACRHHQLKSAIYLITEAHCDVNDRNIDGKTPLHFACANNNLDIVKYLVTEADCDVSVSNKNGESPLHFACMKGFLDIIKILTNKAKYAVNMKNKLEETPLDLACRYGHLNVVKYLVNETSCDSHTKSISLHTACRNGHMEIVKYLVSDGHCDVNVRNNKGETSLHLACERSIHTANTAINAVEPLITLGNFGLVKFLLVEAHCDPNITSKDKLTPLLLTHNMPIIRLLIQHGAIDHLSYHLSLLPYGAPREAAQSTVSLFTLGDKGAGKSTLTTALTTKKAIIIRWTGRLSKVSGVKEKTAGIECHTVHDDRLGHLSIYDAAGHREFHSSHDTVIRSVMSHQSIGILLLVINLAVDLKGAVSYWLSFIQNIISRESSSPVHKPYLIVVGSHSDSVESRKELKEKESLIQHMCEAVEKINFVDYVRVDCRYSESEQLTKLRSHILSIHDILQESLPNISPLAHCFHVYLVSECGSKPGLRLGDVMTRIQADTLLHKEKFLPPTIQALHQACSNLNKRGIMLYIQTQSIERSWIVINKNKLLQEVNGSIFSPSDFSEHRPLTRTGVVPFSKIESSFPQFDPHLIVDFLVHMEFCQEIREEDLLKLVTKAHSEYSKERHFLFPSLTEQSPPPDIWQPQSDNYNCCWILRCLDSHYFSPRLQQVLLLRLAFEWSHAVKPSTSPVLQQQCSMWKTSANQINVTASDVIVAGIKWSTDFVDVMVEITDTNVALFLSCSSDTSMKNKQLELAITRAQVMEQILKAKAEFCGNSIKTVEEFVPNPQYPVTIPCIRAVSVEAIAKSICEGKENVLVAEHNRIQLVKLLHFEPYQFAHSLKFLVDLYSELSLYCLSTLQPFCSKVDDFCNLLNNPLQKVVSKSNKNDLIKAARMIQSEVQSKTTNQSLRELMDKYSIFSGRNILEIAKIFPNSLPSPSLPAVTFTSTFPPPPPHPPLTPLLTPNNTASASVASSGSSAVISTQDSQGKAIPGPKRQKGSSLADSPGIAILIHCDYSDYTARDLHLSPLPGTREDAREMMETFSFLNYIVHQRCNPTGDEIKEVLSEVSAELTSYNLERAEGEEKVIIFAFSGHGNSKHRSEKLYASDGKIIDLHAEIVLPLTKPRGVYYVPKLFFIDACRGIEKLINKGMHNVAELVEDEEVYFEKSTVTASGNFYIGYATIPHHVSYARPGGSIWMPKVAQALRTENEEFTLVVGRVKREVHLQLGNDNKQQCESVNRLNVCPLYLHKRQ